MTRLVHRVMIFAAACVPALSGCAARPPHVTGAPVAPGSYDAAFVAAKDSLREFAFELDRVDGVGGLISTHTRRSSGIATPWIPHSDGLGGAVDGAFEYERRRAVVTFDAPDAPRSPAPETSGAEAPATAAAPAADPGVPEWNIAREPVAPDNALTANVRVWVERVYRPGRRVSPTSVRLSSFTSDPELRDAGLEPAIIVPVREDPSLAAKIAADISRRLGAPR